MGLMRFRFYLGEIEETVATAVEIGRATRPSPKRRLTHSPLTIARRSPIVCRVCFPLVQRLCGKNGATWRQTSNGDSKWPSKQKDEHLGRTSALSASLLERLSGEGEDKRKRAAGAVDLIIGGADYVNLKFLSVAAARPSWNFKSKLH
jgi:hypothetical protein